MNSNHASVAKGSKQFVAALAVNLMWGSLLQHPENLAGRALQSSVPVRGHSRQFVFDGF